MNRFAPQTVIWYVVAIMAIGISVSPELIAQPEPAPKKVFRLDQPPTRTGPWRNWVTDALFILRDWNRQQDTELAEAMNRIEMLEQQNSELLALTNIQGEKIAELEGRVTELESPTAPPTTQRVYYRSHRCGLLRRIFGRRR